MIDEEKAYLVRLIFRSYLQGKQIEEIRQLAAANGLKLKGNSTICRILSNPLYAGLIQLPKNGANASRMIKGMHAPLISESDYWAVQRRLNSKTRATQRNEAVWMKGALHCHCGQILSSDKSKGKSGKYYSYYLCKIHRKNLSAVKLHAQMDAILDLLSLPADSVQRISDKLKSLIDEKLSNKGGDLMRTKINLQKIQDKIVATQERFLSQSDISEKVYRKVISGLKNDEQLLQEQVTELSQTSAGYYNMMEELLPKLTNTRQTFHDLPLERKTAFLRLVFGNSLWYEGQIFRTPYLHPLFSHNVLLLKEKGLLLIEQPSNFSGSTPGSSPSGSWLENLKDLWQILAA